METAWVAPPSQIIGLDHLGVQAPCITIYSTLLPGITNVTDRARYYSLYPWLFTRFDKEKWKDESQISMMLRRAECLITLISLHHGITEGGEQDTHRAAMVGNDVLGRGLQKLQAGSPIYLSDYTKLDDSQDRYFMNPFGGLAQYYFGALRLLKFLNGESVKQLSVPQQTGVKLATLLDKNLPGDLFIETLKDDEVTMDVLSELHPFCACQLKVYEEESNSLISVLRNGWTSLDPNGVASQEDALTTSQRAQSMAMICFLADIASDSEREYQVMDFRGMTYAGHNHNGKALDIPSGFGEAFLKWQTYQRNELLSIALQGLFYAVLRAYDLENLRLPSTEDLSQWFWSEGPGSELVAGNESSFSKYLETLYEQLPAFGDWVNDAHEIQAMQRVNQLTGLANIGAADLVKITSDSLLILSAILHREENLKGYNTFAFIDNYLSRYPVNLNSVRSAWDKKLSAMDVKQGLILLLQQFCLDAHVTVALRKLRQQGVNTFRFELGEQYIVIKGTPQAAQTSPRFRQTIRIMQDLGLLEVEGAFIRTTDSGKSFIKDFL